MSGTILPLAPLPVLQFFDDDTGEPLANGKVYTYRAGSTTQLATYSDPFGAVQNQNPVLLDAFGKGVFRLLGTSAYKFDVQDSAGESQTGYPFDYIFPSGGLATPDYVNVKTYGATGDGSTDDTASIIAAFAAANLAGVPIYFPSPAPNAYKITSTITVPLGQTVVGDDYATTIINYVGTGDAFLVTAPINSSGYGRVTFRDLQITTSTVSNTGAGIDFSVGGYSYFNVEHCRVTGLFKYGIIMDGTEVSTVRHCLIENGLNIANSVNIWVVNGDEHRAGQFVGFSNVITISENQIANGNIGVCDDGGDSIRILGNSFNQNGMPIHMCGRTDFVIEGNSWESQSLQTMPANVRVSDRSGVGGGTLTPDKGVCKGGRITTNDWSAQVIALSSSLLSFTATTALAFHSGISVTNNFFQGQLGRSAAVDVTRLKWSFCGFNTDTDATTSHFTGVHNDANGNVLITPGTTLDTLGYIFGRTDQPNVFYGNVNLPASILTVGSAVSKNANAVADSKIIGAQHLTTTASTTSFTLNTYVYSEQTAGTTGSVQGFESQVFCTNPSATVTLALGVIGNCDLAGAGIVTTQRVFQSGSQIHGAGTGTDAMLYYGVLTGRLSAATGTIANGYGLYLDAAGTGYTNLWGIYSAVGAGANNYVQNHLCVGVTTTTHLFELSTDDAVKPTTNTWTIASDARLKDQVENFTDGMAVMRALRPVSYVLNGIFGLKGAKGVGVLAQKAQEELSPLLREIMIGTTTRDGVDYLTWNDGPLTYVTINALNELDARIAKLEAR